MTAQQFVEEVMGSPLATDDFRKKYAEFQEYQRMALQTLNAFCRVCDQNGIPYQLAWGSLLGAIRDNGQIPWDYDVDVFVPYKEKDRLVEALRRDLDRDYYFYCPETNRNCRHFFMRLAPNGYHSDVLHVDVFYLVGAPEDPEDRTAFAKQVAQASRRRYEKLVNPFRACMGRFKLFVRLCLMRLKMLSVPLRDIEQEYHALCTQYDFDKATCYVSADTFAADVALPAEWVKETVQYPTKEGVFRIPVGYQEVLCLLYKDYTRIFPLKDRLQEMSGHYRNLKKFSKK